MIISTPFGTPFFSQTKLRVNNDLMRHNQSKFIFCQNKTYKYCECYRQTIQRQTKRFWDQPLVPMFCILQSQEQVVQRSKLTATDQLTCRKNGEGFQLFFLNSSYEKVSMETIFNMLSGKFSGSSTATTKNQRSFQMLLIKLLGTLSQHLAEQRKH